MWFLWDGDTFLLYSQPGAQKVRNLAANPRVSLHLNDDGDGGDVVTFEGQATVEPDTPRADRVDGYLGSTGRRSPPSATRRGRSPAPTRRPSGSARPASGSGSAMAVAPEIRELLDRLAAGPAAPAPPVGGAGAGLPRLRRPGPERPGHAGGRRDRPDGARPGRGTCRCGSTPRGRRAVPDRGLVPRRRLGGRHRHLRPAVPGPGRGRPGGGGVGRLPAGPPSTAGRPRSRTPTRPPCGRRATPPPSAAPSTGWPWPATAPAATWPRSSPSGPATGLGLRSRSSRWSPGAGRGRRHRLLARARHGFYLTAAGMRWYWGYLPGCRSWGGAGRLAAAGGLRRRCRRPW